MLKELEKELKEESYYSNCRYVDSLELDKGKSAYNGLFKRLEDNVIQYKYSTMG